MSIAVDEISLFCLLGVQEIGHRVADFLCFPLPIEGIPRSSTYRTCWIKLFWLCKHGGIPRWATEEKTRIRDRLDDEEPLDEHHRVG